jgi:hypothetical protein
MLAALAARRTGHAAVGRTCTGADAVADHVADKVSDDRGVARVVLGNAGLDLAHEVRTHVRSLGVDAAAELHEQRDERRAEAVARLHDTATPMSRDDGNNT